MKKFICGFLMGTILFSFVSVYAATQYAATKATFKVIVNGKEFQGKTGEILVVDNRTYLPLRDMSEVFGIPINWNEDLRQVEIETVSKTTPETTLQSAEPIPIETPTSTTDSQVLQNLQNQLDTKTDEKTRIENKIKEEENSIAYVARVEHPRR